MYTKSQRLRIVEKGWKNFTGPLGGVMFKESISVEPVDPVAAARLGSVVRIERIDTNDQAGYGAEMQRIVDVKAEVVEELPRGVESVVVMPKKQTTPEYTREDLEKIADEKGIAGLRVIADPLGIRGRGISELISEILKGQSI